MGITKTTNNQFNLNLCQNPKSHKKKIWEREREVDVRERERERRDRAEDLIFFNNVKQ
jgi:hypothetical protein